MRKDTIIFMAKIFFYVVGINFLFLLNKIDFTLNNIISTALIIAIGFILQKIIRIMILFLDILDKKQKDIKITL